MITFVVVKEMLLPYTQDGNENVLILLKINFFICKIEEERLSVNERNKSNSRV